MFKVVFLFLVFQLTIGNATYFDPQSMPIITKWIAGVQGVSYTALPEAQFVDVNGDGLVDLVENFADMANTVDRAIYLNTGCGWIDSRTVTLPFPYCNRTALHLRDYDVLTPEQAGLYLQLDTIDVISLLKSKELPGKLLAGKWRVHKSALLKFFQE